MVWSASAQLIVAFDMNNKSCLYEPGTPSLTTGFITSARYVDPPGSTAPFKWTQVPHNVTAFSNLKRHAWNLHPASSTERYATIELDPADASNQALHCLHNFNAATATYRIQYEFQQWDNLTFANKHFSYVVRCKLGPSFRKFDLVDGFNLYWLTLGEFWGAWTSEPLSYRITLALLNTRGGNKMFFELQAGINASFGARSLLMCFSQRGSGRCNERV